MVPLDTLLTSSMTTGPSSITRFNGVRSVTIQGSAASGYSSGEAMAAAEEAAKSVMPTGMTIEWSGESWSMPFAVLFTVPTGIFGAVGSEYIIRQLATLFNANASGFLNSVYMQIGVIMIIGLTAKNAILIVEFAKERVDKGIDPMEAVVIASKLRLRPAPHPGVLHHFRKNGPQLLESHGPETNQIQIPHVEAVKKACRMCGKLF